MPWSLTDEFYASLQAMMFSELPLDGDSVTSSRQFGPFGYGRTRYPFRLMVAAIGENGAVSK